MMKRATFSAPLCAAALLALVAGSFGEALAQSAVITGKVTGRQGEALGGAIVVIDEFSAAVATTTQGTYTLTLAPERTKGQTVTLRARDRKSTRLNSSHLVISYAVFCLKKKKHSKEY